MKAIHIALVVLVIIAASLGGYLVMRGTTTHNTTQATTPQTTTSTTQSQGTVVLQGSGATFPLLQIEKWIGIFQSSHPNIKVSYVGKGSGAGQNDFFNHLVDFAGSDPPLSHDTWLKYKGQVLQIPYLAGAVVIVYNIPEIGDKTLKLTGEVIAKIYLGEIEYWDDPEIKSLNPDLQDKLPHKQIVAVHRSDSSGTTQIFTTFLSKRCSEWKEKVGIGKVVQWPVDELGRGIGGKGNPGVAQAVKNTPYSIGYVEWAYAIKENMNIAAIDNKEGEFVTPSVESIQKTIEAAMPQLPKDPKDDWSSDLEIIIDAPGKGSYPIVAWTRFLVWTHYNDPQKVEALKTWLEWVLTEGRNHIIDGYAPIPQSLANDLINAIENEISSG